MEEKKPYYELDIFFFHFVSLIFLLKAIYSDHGLEFSRFARVLLKEYICICYPITIFLWPIDIYNKLMEFLFGFKQRRNKHGVLDVLWAKELIGEH